MRPSIRAGLLAAVLALTLPGSAVAETLTVDPADPASTPQCQRGTADLTCKTITQALAEAQADDTVSILPGTYAENLTTGISNLTIKGPDTGDAPKIVGNANNADSLLRLSAGGAKVSRLIFEVPAGGGSAIEVTGSGLAALSDLSVTRAATTASTAPLVLIAGGATIARSIVTHQAGGNNLVPAVSSTGPNGVQISETTVLSTVGPAVVAGSTEKNTVVRSTIAVTEATAATSDALTLLSDSAGARKLTSDSSIFIGGPKAAGVQVTTTGASAGAATLVLRHVTVAGAATGIDLDATQAKGLAVNGPAGNITATATSSIVHPASSVRTYDPALLELLNIKNAAKLTFASSDAPQAQAGGSEAKTDMGGASITEDKALFGSALRLRADAPVINRGAAPAGDEADRDIDGDVRVAGPASDIGADEFVSKPPKAAFTASTANPRQTELVTFTSTSTDPDPGDIITQHVWDFGDGTPQQATSSPTVTHAYTSIGTYTARLAVLDKSGGASTAATATITVKDGLPPEVSITTPRSGQRLRLNPTRRVRRKGSKKTVVKKLKPRRLTARGSLKDFSGVQKVEAALTITKRRDGRSGCYQYTGRVFKKLDCAALRFQAATLRGSDFRFRTRRGRRLPPGSYELRIRATDVTGVVATAFSVAAKNLVRFSVR